MIYTLVDKLPVPCPQLREWSRWYARAERRVAVTDVGCLLVSTVFLGMDHQHQQGGPPLLFETMIFDDGQDTYQERCTTWDEAEAMHLVAVAIARERVRAADQLLAGRSS